ncbi:hypothetical protein LTR37_011594 [Vermiconidia calcicola]|uniref:Uncharacterized protein n=1 Tax=Vermiconidia calcicola TaxID=1690605 RepID=A0ACC3N1R8_9PEZI|nr:hypothetical protein LTR37_011594 [Vermiconidia calcicola]
MALRQYHNDLVPFPTPYRGNLYHSNIYRDQHSYPYYGRGYEPGPRRSQYSSRTREQQGGRELFDRTLDRKGDLGWTLEYATAWCYKFLVGNQTEVADVIDKARTLEEVQEKTPYIIFNSLDRALFGGRLKAMVFMRWKSLTSCACGRTSAPGVVPGISRICVELNSAPFEENGGDMDDLLDALIHQMIHAFFLVCCGAQPKGARQDGRLSDGLHFGVVLNTIQDITRQCRDGPLQLIFYAARRRKEQVENTSTQYANAYGYGMNAMTKRNDRPSFISIHPLGAMVPAAPADGQSHCSHDNRSIRPAQVKNWQVEHYARAIDLNMDNKGDIIYDLGTDNQLVPTDRLKGPPSSTYIELVWHDKRIMVPREKSLKFDSLRKPLEKDGKHELKLPDCSMSALRFLYDFLQHRMYWEEPGETLVKASSRRSKGPPVLMSASAASVEGACGMLDHVRVFKVAEDMKFHELQSYALKRLYDMPTTSDDPIDALRELYNDGKDSGKPIHAELHKWARKFLERSEDHLSPYGQHGYARNDAFRGMSNYEKLLYACGDRFEELYHKNSALKDDCKIVSASLQAGGMIQHLQGDSCWDYPSALPTQSLLSPPPIRPLLSRARSWSNPPALDWRWNAQLPSALPWTHSRSLDDSILTPTLPRSRPRLLDWSPSPVSHKYYGRDGRFLDRNVLMG